MRIYIYTQLVINSLLTLLMQKARNNTIQLILRLIKANKYLKYLCMPKGEKLYYIPFSMMPPYMCPHLGCHSILVVYLFIRKMPCMFSTVALANCSYTSLDIFFILLTEKSPAVFPFSPAHINVSPYLFITFIVCVHENETSSFLRYLLVFSKTFLPDL